MNTPPRPTSSDDQQYRRDLTHNLLAVLASNGSTARPVWFGLDVKNYPGMRELIKQRPFDAVRCEIGGTTLTVEITPDPARHGELTDPDALRFGTYDLNEFKVWFYNLLRRSGMTPQQSAPMASSRQPQAVSIRPDLRPHPVSYRNKKRRR